MKNLLILTLLSVISFSAQATAQRGSQGQYDSTTKTKTSTSGNASQLPQRHQSKEALAEAYLQDIASMPEIIEAVKRGNRDHAMLNNMDIMALDKQWRMKSGEGKKIIQNIQNNAASKALQRHKGQHPNAIMEIFVTDKKGLNVAMTNETPEYYQGDEDKFVETMGKGPNMVYASAEVQNPANPNVVFKHITTTVMENHQPIGTVTVNLALQK